MNRSYNRRPAQWVVLVMMGLGVFMMTACGSDTSGEHEAALAEGEKGAWDTTAAFLAGVFTIANADSLDSTVFYENFRANYDWVKDTFLPHLLGTPKHDWWKCDEYCVKTAKMLAKGDKKLEKELMESLARYKLHERERPKSDGSGTSQPRKLLEK